MCALSQPVPAIRRVLYVFTGGRQSRLHEARAGQEAPMEFHFGIPYLEAQGYDVDVLELTDLSPDQHAPAYRALLGHDTEVQQTTGFTSTSHYFGDALEVLNRYDAIVAGGESIALGIAHLIRQGKVRPPLFMMAMGMLAKTRQRGHRGDVVSWCEHVVREGYRKLVRGRDRRRRGVYRDLLSSVSGGLYFDPEDFAIAKEMCPRMIAPLRVAYAPVDTEFWRPGAAADVEEDLIAFIGNDRHRDFDLVIQIARALPQYRFVFVTSKIRQEQCPSNVTVRAGDWKKNLLSDREIREIIQSSAVVLIPWIAGTVRTATSVGLQAMACGKPVLMSKTSGSWEPELRDRDHMWFVHPNGLRDWCRSIETVMRDPATRRRMGDNARLLMERHHNLTVLGKDVERLFEQRRSIGNENHV